MTPHRYRGLAAIASFCAAALLAACASSSPQSSAAKTAAGEGSELEERLAKAHERLEDTYKKMQTSLGLYDDIVGGSAKDPRHSYEKLVDNVDEMEKDYARFQDNYRSLQDRAANHFANWQTELTSYGDADLKAKSEVRMAEQKAAFATLDSSISTFGVTYGTFLTDLHEQIRFFGRDLGPTALAELGDKRVQLDQEANAVITAGKALLVEIEALRAVVHGR